MWYRTRHSCWTCFESVNHITVMRRQEVCAHCMCLAGLMRVRTPWHANNRAPVKHVLSDAGGTLSVHDQRACLHPQLRIFTICGSWQETGCWYIISAFHKDVQLAQGMPSPGVHRFGPFHPNPRSALFPRFVRAGWSFDCCFSRSVYKMLVREKEKRE